MILSRRTAPVSSFQIPQVPRLPTKRPALSLVNGQVDRVQPHALKLNRIGPDLEPEWTFVSGTVVAADQKRLVVSPQANFGRLPHPLLARYMDRDRVSCSAKSYRDEVSPGARIARLSCTARKRRFWPPQNGIVGSLAETDWSGSAAVSGNTRRSDEQRMRFGGYAYKTNRCVYCSVDLSSKV
ncbi:hypothetical protein M0657_011375 [Pyricularia oryzae]|nr:hypothetical protein M9X92_011348 [Pyricularia oryzae]KAI7910430.1 hypothetical protein M0657_011375 [Pyricularia oryzae]